MKLTEHSQTKSCKPISFLHWYSRQWTVDNMEEEDVLVKKNNLMPKLNYFVSAMQKTANPPKPISQSISCIIQVYSRNTDNHIFVLFSLKPSKCFQPKVKSKLFLFGETPTYPPLTPPPSISTGCCLRSVLLKLLLVNHCQKLLPDPSL